MDELETHSDIITLHAPLSEDTQHLINKESIAKMKDGVMIINTSRGGLVDTAALIEGLKTEKVGSAGLDVYEEESGIFFHDVSGQVMQDEIFARLLTFSNVLITSHQAFLTNEALANIASTTLGNIDEFADGKRGAELSNLVPIA
jgi:D-lactate dehydrogenase